VFPVAKPSWIRQSESVVWDTSFAANVLNAHTISRNTSIALFAQVEPKPKSTTSQSTSWPNCQRRSACFDSALSQERMLARLLIMNFSVPTGQSCATLALNMSRCPECQLTLQQVTTHQVFGRLSLANRSGSCLKKSPCKGGFFQMLWKFRSLGSKAHSSFTEWMKVAATYFGSLTHWLPMNPPTGPSNTRSV